MLVGLNFIPRIQCTLDFNRSCDVIKGRHLSKDRHREHSKRESALLILSKTEEIKLKDFQLWPKRHCIFLPLPMHVERRQTIMRCTNP
jgi:hypothetical protein